MYRLVVLACAVATAAAEADPAVAYANGLTYAAAPVAVAAAPAVDLTPRAIPHAVPAAVSHSLGLPEAAGYALPPVRQVQEAPIVEQFVEPVEQWGYKVAY